MFDDCSEAKKDDVIIQRSELLTVRCFHVVSWFC